MVVDVMGGIRKTGGLLVLLFGLAALLFLGAGLAEAQDGPAATDAAEIAEVIAGEQPVVIVEASDEDGLIRRDLLLAGALVVLAIVATVALRYVKQSVPAENVKGSVPAEIVQLLLPSLNKAIDVLATYAKSTPTPIDDAAVQQLQTLIAGLMNVQSAQKAEIVELRQAMASAATVPRGPEAASPY